MILKIFSPKILAIFAKTTVSFCKNCDHNIGFWEKRQFFRRTLEKIAENVIITSTPGLLSRKVEGETRNT
jgi:hypothetical protein